MQLKFVKYQKYTEIIHLAYIPYLQTPSGLRRCNQRIGRFLVQTPLHAQPSLGSQSRYESPGDF